jgi:hypothetical protein
MMLTAGKEPAARKQVCRPRVLVADGVTAKNSRKLAGTTILAANAAANCPDLAAGTAVSSRFGFGSLLDIGLV